ncbi:MAG: helix-turn-helix domain-containing protein [Ruminococcaceae bacterium]|nr:helix-turn-helix domain-containing protein [Oscillospiraceae bacterium]
MDMIKIGKLISKRRNYLGYTQDELGERIGVSGKAVSKWERVLSAPDVSLISRIAVELKLSIAQFLEGNVADFELSSNSIHLNDITSEVDFDFNDKIDFSNENNLGIVSPFLFGNNLEHTRSSVCNGLSAQMLKNRKFVGKPSAMEGVAQGWYVIGEKTYCAFSSPYTHHYNEHYHMKRMLECNAQQIINFYGGTESGIGQHEIYISSGVTYEFAIVLKSREDIELKVTLSDRWGKNMYASRCLKVSKNDNWVRYTIELSPDHSDPDGDLRITFDGECCIDIGCVSLMNKANFRGMRLDVIEAMKDIGIKLLRWPGGNFAGEYNWFDGLLDVDERAPLESYQHLETQPHTLGYDFHEINTDDFIALCREIGAEPFITINPAWNTPEENAAWVEYCNGDANTTYGRLRSERGNDEPYNVMLWSLGNEFGYGHMEGDNSANGYSHLARENGTLMLEKSPNLTLCSSGPYPNKEWVEYSAKPLSDIAKFVSLHFYAGGYRNGPSYASAEKIKESYNTCVTAVKSAQSRVRDMREHLGNDRLKISFDEWNVWYGWYRPSCLLDGVFTGMMMNMIIKEAQNLGIGFACQFEAVNESAIKVTPANASLTATGQALALMTLHAGGTLRYADDCSIATEKEGRITITVVNPSYDMKKTVSFECKKDIVLGKLYEGKSLCPHNRFEISDLSVCRSGDYCNIEIAPHSMAFIQY